MTNAYDFSKKKKMRVHVFSIRGIRLTAGIIVNKRNFN